jgi:dTDP-4-dehydrorhamnose 3,5-epimerase-like enzyme
MRVYETALPEVKIIEPRVLRDARGLFLEAWQQARYLVPRISLEVRAVIAEAVTSSDGHMPSSIK